MALGNVFKTSTRDESPLDGSGGSSSKDTVSDFLTIQSFANFPTMVGALTAVWHGLQRPLPQLASIWTPYILAAAFGLVSYVSSLNGLKKNGKLEFGTCLSGAFVALLNSIVLAGAIVGTDVAVGLAASPPRP